MCINNNGVSPVRTVAFHIHHIRIFSRTNQIVCIHIFVDKIWYFYPMGNVHTLLTGKLLTDAECCLFDVIQNFCLSFWMLQSYYLWWNEIAYQWKKQNHQMHNIKIFIELMYTESVLVIVCALAFALWNNTLCRKWIILLNRGKRFIVEYRNLFYWRNLNEILKFYWAFAVLFVCVFLNRRKDIRVMCLCHWCIRFKTSNDTQ